jgi:photosystem II stability/assembly factor-like uncharacterized protein
MNVVPACRIEPGNHPMRILKFCALWMLALAAPLQAQSWRAMGPSGGDVRTLTASSSQPGVVYLGTADGHIFGSTDGGGHWQILGRAGTDLSAVVTSLLVDPRDPRTLYASTWSRERTNQGGVYISHDSGVTWAPSGLGSQEVRALVQAPSHPDELFAGTLDGVFRSLDAGKTWERISPENHEELRNFDSLALDPKNPSIIYAGTFHLPWKTVDGGKHWNPIHAGMIDDSDVMSLMVDSKHPHRLFASACSGIYRSDDSGAGWKKIQGIPFSARRTYVIREDPAHPSTVYAATSEGLWQSRDSGGIWHRITPHDWVINSVAVVPGNVPGSAPEGAPQSAAQPGGSNGRILIGTDQLCVLASDDGGENFYAVNEGFNHRHIVSLALDSARPGRVLAILANAPEPVLATDDSGLHWSPLGPGLRAEGLKRVYASPSGWWAALEKGGLMRYDAEKSAWIPAGSLAGDAAQIQFPEKADKHGRVRPQPRSTGFRSVVNDMAFSSDIWFAATDEGLLASRDSGATWSFFHFAPLNLPVSSVGASPDGKILRIVSLRGMVDSTDGGATWSWHDLPFEAGGALRLEIVDPATLLATSHVGLYISRDAGRTWERVASGLPEVPVQDLALTSDVWLASMQVGGLYISRDRAVNWSRVEGTLADGYFLSVTPGETASLIYAASTTEGLYAIDLTRVSASVSHVSSPGQPSSAN